MGKSHFDLVYQVYRRLLKMAPRPYRYARFRSRATARLTRTSARARARARNICIILYYCRLLIRYYYELYTRACIYYNTATVLLKKKKKKTIDDRVPPYPRLDPTRCLFFYALFIFIIKKKYNIIIYLETNIIDASLFFVYFPRAPPPPLRILCLS